MDWNKTSQEQAIDLAHWAPVVIPSGESYERRSFTWDQAQRILRKNMRPALAVLAAVMLASIVLALMVKDVYQPTARIEIDPPGSGIKTLHEIEYANEIDNQDYLETQAQILKSDALAVAVIRALHLDRDAELVSARDVAKYGDKPNASQSVDAKAKPDDSFLQDQMALADRTQLESIAVEKFQRKLAVSPIRNSRLIEVSYTSRNPAMAQSVTNALVTQFIDQNYRNRYTSTMEASDWLSRQLNDLREKVQESNQAVADYQQKYGFVEADDHDVPLAQLMDNVNRQFSDASANRIEAEAYVRMIDLGESDSIPAVRDDQLYQNLMTRFADARAQVAQARTIYGDDNSNVKKLENESTELAAQVEAERTRMVNRVRTDYAAALEREQMMQKARERLRAQMGDTGSHMVGYKILKNEALATGELYNTLQARLKEAGIYAGLKSSNIRVIDLAPRLRTPTAPNRGLIIGAGSLFGCFLALGFCFVKESLDSTLRSPDDIKQTTGLPSLAMIPKIRTRVLAPANRQPLGARVSEDPKVFFEPRHSAESEAIRDLRAGLTLRGEHSPQVILVTSPSASEGKTTVAANLAAALALRGTTCLVDADLRRPKIAEMFGVRPTAGITDLLSGQSGIDSVVVQAPRSPGLSLLCGTHEPPNPGELITSDRVKQAIATLRECFEYVVIDSPPVIPVADARVLSSLVDAVILVGRYESTTRRSLARASQMLSEAGGTVAGVVLNDIDYSSADYRYFNYGSNRSSESALYDGVPASRTGNRKSGEEPPKSRGAHA
jgi:capsular exopolysaccharide synthesis family protein